MDAALRSSFDRFGGALAQANNLSIITHIAIVGYPSISMLYDEELQNRIAKYARERTHAIDYFQLISTLQVDILRTAHRRATNLTTQRPPIKIGVKRQEAKAIKETVWAQKVGAMT